MLIPAILWHALPTVIQYAFLLLFTVAQFALLFWFLSRGGVDVYYPDDIKTRFSDVWGQDHVLERVKENIIFLENPELVEDRGGYVPGGILLWGPPGTGKTLMAEAVAGETGKPYVFVDPGAFINMFMGVGVLKVKGLFRKLRKLSLRYGGVIVFFDEADSLGNRGIAMGGAPGGGRRGLRRRSRRPAATASPTCRPTCQWRMARDAMTSQFAVDPAEPGAQRGTSRSSAACMNGGMGGGGMGTLQALLTELSGLKKPRGFINRVVRRALGMRPKPPPHYRILVMMATNMPSALDEALLRPGRIDRIYRVGYPSKAGRVRTYEGYLAKVSHELTAEQIDKLATITPYATGATIKDLVNEALIIAIRDGRDVITYQDVIKAKQLKELGPPEDVEYIERERHAVAIHEACHAVVAYRTTAAHGDRHRHDREGQRLPRHGVVDQAGGPVHPVAQRVRVRHPGGARLAGRGADVLRQRQLVRRLRRPGLRDHRRLLHGGVLGHGQDGVLRRLVPPPRGRHAGRRPRAAAAPGAGDRGPRARRRSAGSRTGSRTTWACCLSRPRRSCATTSGTCSRSRTRSSRTRRSAARTSPRSSRAGAARWWTARRTRTTRSSPSCASTTWRPSARTSSTTSRSCRCRSPSPRTPSPTVTAPAASSTATAQRQRERHAAPARGRRSTSAASARDRTATGPTPARSARRPTTRPVRRVGRPREDDHP